MSRKTKRSKAKVGSQEKIRKEEVKVDDAGEELSDHECYTEPSTSGIMLKLAAQQFGRLNSLTS